MPTEALVCMVCSPGLEGALGEQYGAERRRGRIIKTPNRTCVSSCWRHKMAASKLQIRFYNFPIQKMYRKMYVHVSLQKM